MDSNDLINNEDLFDALKQEPEFAWPSIILFFICAGFIFGATWAAIYGHISYLAACLINGTSGYFLFSPMHDSIHSSLGNSKQLNLWVGRISFLFYSSLVAFELMRFIHFRHHRNANGDGDEADGVIQSGPGWFRPLKWPFLDLIYAWKYKRYWKERPVSEKRNIIIMILVTMVMWPWLVINGYLTELLVFWIIPQRISFFLIAFIFVYLPHVPNDVSEQENAYRATSIREGMEWLLSPLMMYQNYHLVHHLYPNVPFYRMVKIWNSRLDEHLSHDPAIVPALGLYPRPAKTPELGDSE
jgi:ring-1,2-phenylacetyl-CoA epoxidase subunit PaaE